MTRTIPNFTSLSTLRVPTDTASISRTSLPQSQPANGIPPSPQWPVAPKAAPTRSQTTAPRQPLQSAMATHLNAGLLRSIETAVRAKAPWNGPFTKAEELVQKHYVLAHHMVAISEAARLGNFAVSFRVSGEATLRCLKEGAPAKGHDILEKTVKSSSVADAYGSRAAEVLSKIQNAEIDGYVAHWGPERIRGLYMSPETAEQAPGLRTLLKRTDSGHAYLPVDIENLEVSLAPLTNAGSHWKKLPFTGDYDTHDLINFSGQRGQIPSDSAAEKRAMDAMNKAIETCDPARPAHRVHQRVVRHGPQSNYVAHMLDQERGQPLVGAVARSSLPVAICDRGNWRIIETATDLQSFYDERKLNLKTSWRADSRSFRKWATGA